MPSSSSSAPRTSFPRRHWGKLTLASLLIVPVVVMTAWSMIALTYTYSDGSRTGYNQKLSRKGWLCKTWEGELALSNVPGQAPQLFFYSVREDSVARQIQALEGARVALSYEEHKGVPFSCFGETAYFANAVRRVDDGMIGVPVAPATPVAPPAPVPAPTPAPAPVP